MRFSIIIILCICPALLKAQTISTYVGPGGITNAQGLAFDKYGDLFLCTGISNKILKIDTLGTISTFAGTGTLGFSGDSGLATNAKLAQPAAVTFDSAGNIIFSDAQNSRIRKIDITTNIITTIAGISVAGYNGDNIPATDAELHFPNYICFDRKWNLIVADFGNARIRVINHITGLISTIAGDGTYGIIYGDGGQATSAKCSPHGICVDGIGNIIFCQYGSGACTIRKIDTLGIISTIAGDSSAYSYNGDNIPATAAHLDPYALAIDNIGDIYVTDFYNNRVRKIDTFQMITTVAGDGIVGFGGDSGPADSAKMHGATGITLDGCSNIYFSDLNNSRVRKVTFDTTCYPWSPLASIIENKPELNIYPNPATTEITIDGAKGGERYAVLNIIGIMEQSGILQSGTNNIPIKDLPPGIKLVEIITPDGVKVVRRVVKE